METENEKECLFKWCSSAKKCEKLGFCEAEKIVDQALELGIIGEE